MKNSPNKLFDVKILHEKDYSRLYVTHCNFKGRIRKRLGKKSPEEFESIAFNIKYELGKHFISGEITKEDVESFINNYLSMHVKCDASIFDYKTEFFKDRADKFNKKTKCSTSKSTLSGYRTALRYFEEFLITKRIFPHPIQITDTVLDNFYKNVKGGHNYKVKLHTKVKGFIIFLDKEKHIPINPSYKKSVFTEEYDNQSPEDDDIAIPKEDVLKLIDLRQKFQRGEIKLESFTKSEKIPLNLQQHQFNMKSENIIKCLDCFLLMISTGMYYADIKKSKLYFSTHGNVLNMNYRRAKNGSLCRAIPIQNDDIFIGKEIISQYKIRSGSNFPLNLSLTHFGKHLDRISAIAELPYKLNNKMARKTFASIFYFKRELPINLLQILLGHKNVKDTAHYLRITNDDIAIEVMKHMSFNLHNS